MCLAGECTMDDIIVEGPYGMMIKPPRALQSMVELSRYNMPSSSMPSAR